MTKKTLPYYCLALLILLGITWGTGYSIARFAITNGVPALGYSFWQSLGPALALGCITYFSSKKTKTRETTTLTYYLVSGLTGIVIPNTTMYFAAPHLPASILALIVNLGPVITYPLALFVKQETFNIPRLIGIVLALLGLLCIILPDMNVSTSIMSSWVIVTLITPLSFGVCSIYVARYRPVNQNALHLSAGMLVCSSIILLPLVLGTHNFYLFHWPLNTADKLVLLEILLSSIGYILYFHLIKIAGPVYNSLVDTTSVLTGVFWGHLIFAEQLNKWTATAVCLIIMALILVTQQQRTQPNMQAQLNE